MAVDKAVERQYLAANIFVISFDHHVRKQPAMYLGVTQHGLALPRAVVHAVIADAPYAPEHGPTTVDVCIGPGWRLSLSDDIPVQSAPIGGRPRPGFFGSLIDGRLTEILAEPGGTLTVSQVQQAAS